MLFKQLAANWMADMQNRLSLGDLKPASLCAFESRARLHILPYLGEQEVEAVRNGTIKTLAENLSTTLGPKSVREVVAQIKYILDSYIDQDGEPILALRFNRKFILKAVRKVGKQRQPTISQEALNAILGNPEVKIRDRVFLAFAASTGLRIGELLALRHRGDDTSTTWDQAGGVVRVRQSVWGGQLQSPKTDAAVRDIDVSAPVNQMMAQFCKGKTPGSFIFANRSGKPLGRSYVHEEILVKYGVPGCHSLRRFRATWCDEQRTPRSLLSAWLGHAVSGDGITSIYIKSAENLAYRREWAEKIGTGLHIPLAA